MESIREQEATTLSSEIYIKAEPVFAEPYQQPCEEIEQIDIKEENVKLEIPEDHDVCDPLQLKKEDDDTEEETTSLPDGMYIKTEPELQIEEESTSCSSESESKIHVGVEDERTDARGSVVTRFHLPTDLANIVECNIKQEASLDYRSKALSCPICTMTAVYFRPPNGPKKVLSPKHPHPCCVCHTVMMTIDDLKKHFRLHSVAHYICHVCQKSFATIGALHMHSQHHWKHSQEHHYICEVCDKTFKLFINLQRHSRLHNDDCDYICKVCHKTFQRFDSANKHSCIRRYERLYVCRVCHKTFGSKSALKNHSYVHVSETSPHLSRVSEETNTEKQPEQSIVCEETHIQKQPEQSLVSKEIHIHKQPEESLVSEDTHIQKQPEESLDVLHGYAARYHYSDDTMFLSTWPPSPGEVGEYTITPELHEQSFGSEEFHIQKHQEQSLTLSQMFLWS